MNVKMETKQNDYRFRKFREEDLEKVVWINRLCLPENYSPYFFLELHKNYPETFFVAEYENNIVGYVMARIETGFSEIHRFKIVKKGHIISIAVVPEHRLKGVGTRLMLNSLRGMVQFYGCSETYLEVRVSNHNAIAMYKKLGYREVRRIPHYYLDGEDASLMCRELKHEEFF